MITRYANLQIVDFDSTDSVAMITTFSYTNTTPNTSATTNTITYGLSTNNVNYVGNLSANQIDLVVSQILNSSLITNTQLFSILSNYLTVSQFQNPTAPITEDLDSGSF